MKRPEVGVKDHYVPVPGNKEVLVFPDLAPEGVSKIRAARNGKFMDAGPMPVKIRAGGQNRICRYLNFPASFDKCQGTNRRRLGHAILVGREGKRGNKNLQRFLSSSL